MLLVDHGVILMAHAPKGGATINGKEYKGGQFIPGDELASASPEELKAAGIESDAAATPSWHPKTKSNKLSSGGVKVSTSLPKGNFGNANIDITEGDIVVHAKSKTGKGEGNQEKLAIKLWNIWTKPQFNKLSAEEFSAVVEEAAGNASNLMQIATKIKPPSKKKAAKKVSPKLGGIAKNAKKALNKTAKKKSPPKKAGKVVGTVEFDFPKGNFPFAEIDIKQGGGVHVAAGNDTGKGVGNEEKLEAKLQDIWSQHPDIDADEFTSIVESVAPKATTLMSVAKLVQAKIGKQPPKSSAPKGKIKKAPAGAAKVGTYPSWGNVPDASKSGKKVIWPKQPKPDQIKSHVQYAKNKMSWKQKDAVDWYVNSSGPEANAQLRKCPKTMNCINAQSRAKIKAIDEAIAKAPPLPEGLTVFRGIRVNNAWAKKMIGDMKKAMDSGQEMRINMNGVKSTTTDPNVAKKFSNSYKSDTEQVVFEIKPKKGLAVTGEMKYYGGDEKEVIMSSQSMVRPVNYFKVGGKTIIQMEEV